jgi:hypothetical protein
MSKFKIVLAVLGVVALAAPAAFAGTTGVEVFGAFNMYSMGDVNDQIKADNTGGASFDELSNSLGGGLGMRTWPNQNWMIEACWEPLLAETKSAPTASTWNLNANSFQVSAYRFFPSANPKAHFGVGGGMGLYSVSGKHVDGQTPATTKVEGSGPGIHFMGVGEWSLSQGLNLTAGAGYRVASIDVDGLSNSTASADYSGFVGRVGLAFYFPQNR